MARMGAEKGKRENHSEELVDMPEDTCAVCTGMVKWRIVTHAWLIACSLTAGVWINGL